MAASIRSVAAELVALHFGCGSFAELSDLYHEISVSTQTRKHSFFLAHPKIE